VVILDRAVSLPIAPLAPANYLDQFAQPALNSTEFLTIGYGTEVRKADSGPQTPTPMREPIVRRYTSEIGQKLIAEILQTNGTSTTLAPAAAPASMTPEGRLVRGVASARRPGRVRPRRSTARRSPGPRRGDGGDRR
jgi:hypothetical protein